MTETEQKNVTDTLYRNFGFSATRLTRIKSGVMNENYKVETANGDYILRISRSASEAETALERFMLQTLASEGFPCPKPLSNADGHDTIFVNGKIAIVYPMLTGKQSHSMTPKLLKEIGRLQATIHTTFLNKTIPVQKSGWDPEDIKRLIPEWRSRIEASNFPDAKTFLDFIEREIATITFPSNLPRGLTHQDIKPENVLVENERVTGILDFDNCYEGALLHDLTTTIIWWCFVNNELSLDLVAAFREGYESVRRITSDEDRLLLTDGLRFRLLREMFIGPMTTLSNISLATERATHFRTLYASLQ